MKRKKHETWNFSDNLIPQPSFLLLSFLNVSLQFMVAYKGIQLGACNYSKSSIKLRPFSYTFWKFSYAKMFKHLCTVALPREPEIYESIKKIYIYIFDFVFWKFLEILNGWVNLASAIFVCDSLVYYTYSSILRIKSTYKVYFYYAEKMVETLDFALWNLLDHKDLA